MHFLLLKVYIKGAPVLYKEVIPMLGWIGLMAALMFVWIFALIFAVAFWFMMLVDCLKRKRFEDKLVWVIVLLLLNIVGAALYYFLVKKAKN